MNRNFDKINTNFMQLVLSLQDGAMQQMGKVISSVTGKVEKDLLIAKTTIDILVMIEEKTKGNLTEEEGKLLSHILYELRMNYTDEAAKVKTADSKEENTENSEKTADSKEENTENSENPEKEEKNGGEKKE